MTESKYGPGFRVEALGTSTECRLVASEIEAEISTISGQIEVYDDEPRNELDDRTRAWLSSAHVARSHRRRLLAAVRRREQELSGWSFTPDPTRAENRKTQIDVQQAIARRKREEHAAKMERIAATNAQESQRYRLFQRLVRERLGDEEIDLIWAKVNDIFP